eukprot:357907-Amphidinium_carterae.1
MEVEIFMDNRNQSEDDQQYVMRRMLWSTVIIGIITLVITTYTSWKLCKLKGKTTTRDQSTQTSTLHDSDGAQDAIDEIFVYPQGRRYHDRSNCIAVTGARSQPRRYSRCQVCWSEETSVT